MLPLRYLSNFWRTLEMSLINCEINLKLTWSEKSIMAANITANQEKKFVITDTRLYDPVVTLSTDDNLNVQLVGICKNQKY